MDEINQAQHYDELYRQSALNRHLAGLRDCRAGQGPARNDNGICIDCGEKINKARLKALPHAVRCLGCQNKSERRDKHGFI